MTKSISFQRPFIVNPCSTKIISAPASFSFVLIFKITTLIFYLLRSYINFFSNFLTEIPRKTQATIYYCLQAKLPTRSNYLVRTRNIARIRSIWSGSDKSKSIEFLRDAKLHFNAKYDVQGAITSGICLGSSLVALQIIIKENIQNEAELIKCVTQFQNGFPDEATALQNISMHIDNFNVTIPLDRLKTVFIEKKRIVGEKKALNLFELSMQHYFYECMHQIMGKFIHLVQTPTPIDQVEAFLFKNICNKKNVQDRFDQIPSGYYAIILKANRTKNHAIAYLKYTFGSYLIDPNIGLIKCCLTKPSTEFCKLLKEQYPGIYRGRYLRKKQDIDLHQFTISYPYH